MWAVPCLLSRHLSTWSPEEHTPLHGNRERHLGDLEENEDLDKEGEGTAKPSSPGPSQRTNCSKTVSDDEI